MAFTRQQHLRLASIVSHAGQSDQGTALALMGVVMILLLINLERSSEAPTSSGIISPGTIQIILNSDNTLSNWSCEDVLWHVLFGECSISLIPWQSCPVKNLLSIVISAEITQWTVRVRSLNAVSGFQYGMKLIGGCKHAALISSMLREILTLKVYSKSFAWINKIKIFVEALISIKKFLAIYANVVLNRFMLAWHQQAVKLQPIMQLLRLLPRSVVPSWDSCWSSARVDESHLVMGQPCDALLKKAFRGWSDWWAWSA